MLPDLGRPRRLILLAVGLLVGLLLTSCGGGSEEGSGADSSAGPAAAHNEADVRFATEMIPHHRQAVEMSTLAETRALSQQVKALAATIKTAQEPEIESMTTWLTAWGAPVPAADGGTHSGHSGRGMATPAEMQELAGKRGAAFDEVFLTRMIAHHEGAIAMAQEEQRAGQYAPAKELAAMIVSTQQSEITQMKELQGQS